MTTVPCPICEANVGKDVKYRPFCSQRCKLVDLGRWLDGDYALPGPPVGGLDIDDERMLGRSGGDGDPDR